jgi:uncharacterized radical SAM protein YgiQ
MPEPSTPAYDIILIVGELYFDHPLSGTALIKRWLEKHDYKVGVIAEPKNEEAIATLGAPRLFFGVSSGTIDSLVRNYTPLKRRRSDDPYSGYTEEVPDRAVIVYCNWLRHRFKGVPLVLGGTESTLRRFTHYDYWDNKPRRSILLDTRADILVFGSGEKQVLEIAQRLEKGEGLMGIPGTCVVAKEMPSGFTLLPSHEEAVESKERFCDHHNLLTNAADLAEPNAERFVLQYHSPKYTSSDLDEYYELPFTRDVPELLRGFEFSVVTHRGCIGNCSFCALRLIQGEQIVSRSVESILREIAAITRLPHFKGNIDDLGGPSANMYGMDCDQCARHRCIDCPRLDRTNQRLIELLRWARAVPGVKHVYIKSGVRYDLATPEYLKELVEGGHIFDTLRIAPEHVNPEVLRLMRKDKGNLQEFVTHFKSIAKGKELSYYFMVGHPGSGLAEAKELGEALKKLDHVEGVQLFTPTPMTAATCMYHTGLEPESKKPVHVPYTYHEKKQQKRLALDKDEDERLPPGTSIYS